MKTLPRVAVAAVGVVTAAMLAGCGVADGGARPGVAAEVNGTTIAVSDVEAAAEDRCEVLEELADESSEGQVVSGGRVRDLALQGAVIREIADQLAEEYHVGPGRMYDDARAEIRSRLEGLDEDLVDRAVESLSSTNYFVDILIEVGREELGISRSQDPEGQQGFQEGLEIAQAWQEEHTITTNPRYAAPIIGNADEGVLAERDDLSVAVSDFAQVAGGAADDPQNQDAGYAAGLPDNQRCGGS